MKKLLFCMIMCTSTLQAQIFDEIPQLSVLSDVGFSSTATGDLNGDSFPDLIITGRDNSGGPVTELYLNDGNGQFTVMENTPFQPVQFSAIALADVDNNGSLDLFITGVDNSLDGVAKLYLNNGEGVFTEQENSPFVPIALGALAVADVNGDAYLDILVSGVTDYANLTFLYLNDGNGGFLTGNAAIFEGVVSGSLALADFNGDMALDVLLTGENGIELPVAKLYLNDSTGNFEELIGPPFEGVVLGATLCRDFNTDGTTDVLICGQTNTGEEYTRLYFNDGNAVFTEALNTPFTGLRSASIIEMDINNDEIPDVYIQGNAGTERIAQIYLNDGSGHFTEDLSNTLAGVNSGTASFTDLNGDSFGDLFVTGIDNFIANVAEIYTNNGQGNLEETPDNFFESLNDGGSQFADLNGDGHVDAIIVGSNGSAKIAKLYFGNGEGNFVEVLNTPFVGISDGVVLLSDVNGDDYLDVVIHGAANGGGFTTKLYFNDGLGSFSEAMDTPFQGINGDIAVVDVNSDGAPEVFISGELSQNNYVARQYLNDGFGNFMELPGFPFFPTVNGDFEFADINGDGFPDVVITGWSGSDTVASIYLNDGDGTFSEAQYFPFEGVDFSKLAFADVNGDLYPDVLITGFNLGFDMTAKLYLNDGTGNFTLASDTPFPGASNADIQFADVNNDTYQDVFLSGFTTIGNISNLYLNDGTGNFTLLNDTPFPPVLNGASSIADVNGDQLLDVLIAGNFAGKPTTKLFINQGIINSTENEGISSSAFLQIFPNPLSTEDRVLSFEVDYIGSGTVSIFNRFGRLVMSSEMDLQEGENKMPIKEFSPGIYFFKVEQNGRSVSRPFVIL